MSIENKEIIKNQEYPFVGEYSLSDGIKREFHYKNKLNSSECASFVEAVVNNVVSIEDGYLPYNFNLGYCHALINYYTDIKIDQDNLLATVEELLDNEFIGDFEPLEKIDHKQLENLKKMIYDLIQHRKALIENKSEFDNLVSDVRNILSIYNDAILKAAKPKTINKFIDGLNELIGNANQYLDGNIK